jgi:uncharacterized spore protein YtfJ
MDDTTRDAHAEAEARAALPDLLQRLADRLGAHVGASAAFGEPVEQDGRTVIPVAQSMIGTGVGGGGEGAESGLGGGGGAMTRPLGYIEVTAAGAEFVPLKKPWLDAKIVFAFTLLIFVSSRAIVRLIRG